MIVRPRPHWLHLLFVRRGSMIRAIFSQQLFIFALPSRGTAARPFVLGLIAFATTMRNQLRGLPREKDTAQLLPPEIVITLRTARCAPVLVLQWLGEFLQNCRARRELDPQLSRTIEESLNGLSAALGACERIAGTPLPFTYSVILHRSAYLYCMLLPFGLVDSIGLMTPLVVTFVSYTFFALEALSDEIEEPFGLMANDLALDAMLAGIDASLRELLGETPPPAPLPDHNFQLS